ncbi:MAG: peptidoglycan DD-metalloendopeptidase family protein [Nitrospiraceae bacterium]|nr:peptidoglycan DD-metalloendopeptidase family protein [Nitrospiraceae bacterium]
MGFSGPVCKKLFCALALLVVLFPARGSGAEDVKQRYKKIQNEIKQHQQNLERARRKETSILGELQDMDKSLSGLEKELSANRLKLNGTNARISQTKTEMAGIGQKLNRHQDWLKSKLKAMQRQGRGGDLVMLLGSGDMSDFMRRWHYLQILAVKEKEAFETYKGALAQLREKQAELDSLNSRLKVQEARTAKAEENLNAKRAEKNNLLASVRSEKASHSKMIEELRQASERLLQIIKRSEEGGYKGKGFRALKGRLSWPVNGVIVYGYGRGTDPRFNTPLFRNGVYIKTAPNAQARAVCDGKVVYADWFKGYGQLVIINHGSGYHTLYANLNEIFLKVGDIIENGAAVGRVGESSMINAPTLYFEVRYKGKPLNPMQWLGRR